MAWSNRVTTTTNQEILPRVVDTILNSNVLLTRVLQRVKKWNGETMKFPIKYQKGIAGSSFSGYDTFSTTASNTRVNLSFTPKFYEMPVSLPLDEISVNATEKKVIDLISLEMKSRAQDMADELGVIIYGDGTGNSSKDFLGLGAIVDDGGAVATYGGLSRTTYSTLNATDTASGGTLTLAKIDTLYDAVASGSVKPTVGISDESVFTYLGQLMQPFQRINVDASYGEKELTAQAGFLKLVYRGVPYIKDEKATSGYLFLLNEDFLNFYALPMYGASPIAYKATDIAGNDYNDVLGLGFSWSDWIKPINQAALVGHIYLGGELISDNPKRHGRLTGITGI